MVKFSIIIPVKEINDYIRNFIPINLKQSYRDFEIIILPNEIPKDKKDNFKDKRVKIIPSGNIGPAEKRDLGVKKSKGEIIAFIDDDAYPEKDWLKNSLKFFQNPDVAAVGGPNLTPKESNFFQKVSGEVLASYLVSGPVNFRYKPGKEHECDDLPSCNFLVRKSMFNKIKGFDTSFWPGEDTKLCLDIINQGKKIIYTPKLLVYHHRRDNLKGYINQISTYAKHRGFFAKRYPKNSLKLSYAVPSLFVIGLIAGFFVSLFSSIIATIYNSVLLLYFLILFLFSLKTRKLNYILAFIAISFITHISYGLGFINGLFMKELKSKYR
jgi:GT2 family glycosyltransferase